VQAGAVVGAGIVLYAAGRSWRLAPPLATALALCYLANPYLHRGLDFDFHPEMMAGLPVFAALWAIGAKRYRLAMWLSLAPLLLKEDAALVSVGLAALLWECGAKREARRTAL